MSSPGKLSQLRSNLKIPKFPDDCYKWQTKIRYSDLDNNMHTNQSVYIKLCLDGATCAALTGKLRHFNADITWQYCDRQVQDSDCTV
jgi:acyl-ACP thioesterase